MFCLDSAANASAVGATTRPPNDLFTLAASWASGGSRDKGKVHKKLDSGQFGGYAKEEEDVNYAAKLRFALGSEATYRKDFYLCNGYDPPMKPYWRRNEVWFVKE
ncbi:splicing factor 3A subunit 2 [Platysternon megacephalum]|uniref:Splicing factor 3A subunit 2 n=1 Tax=Platysternon megacephalum TaxID=55544 RepID=A0A4D9E9B5_9SAUR|nr:splicing factor 3A subunit 2 [Platysternon megacephalum]